MKEDTGVLAGVDATVYYATIASSVGLDAHAYQTGGMGTPEYGVRTVANFYSLNPFTGGQLANFVTTAMDGYQCAASLEFIGNYD